MDGTLEMRAEFGKCRGDPTHHFVDRAPDVLAGPFGLGCHRPIATAKTQRPGQLARDEVELLLRPRRPLQVRPGAGLFQLLAQFLNTRSIRRFGVCVQGRSCTSGVVRTQVLAPFGDRAGFARRRPVGGGDDFKHVDVGTRVLEQHSEIAEALGVPQPRLTPAKPKRPIIALAPEPLDCALAHRSSPRL